MHGVRRPAIMAEQIRFRVRPGYKSQDLLVQFCDEHRAEGFPDVAGILARALHASPKKHPDLDVVAIGLATDRFFSYWQCLLGEYEIDNDIWALFISAKKNNAIIIEAVEKALLESGKFAKEDVDFSQYA
jgi:hypothetical protein